MQALQYLPELETKPKEFWIGAGFYNTVGMSASIGRDLEILRNCVEAGKPLPPRMYRRERSSSRDPLLEAEGIMHLHVGDDRKDLLFLYQFEHQVWAICITDHAPFRDVPVGKTLRQRASPLVREWHASEIVKRRAAARALQIEHTDLTRDQPEKPPADLKNAEREGRTIEAGEDEANRGGDAAPPADQ